MRMNKRWLGCLALASACAVLAWWAAPSSAYVEAPHSLGQVIQLSSNIMIVRVERVDRDKNLIIYRKIEDLKGKHPTDIIKHNIGRGGIRPNEWKHSMDWAEPGKIAVFFHNGGASETCLGTYWYQAYAGGEWWNHSHGEPFLLRTFAGNPDKLIAAVREILAGREVIVPCMVNGNLEDLHNRRAKIERLKASLKLGNYDEKRDFVGWGGEDFRRLSGMPGFTHYSALTRVDPEAQAISSVDFDGDGKTDLCLAGGSRVVLLQNGGESLNEVALPGAGGCRAAVWADYNGDGLPDLLLATLAGPKLYTNLGKGRFRDDSHLLPLEPYYTLTAAAWIDYDGDGKPDILLADGYHGLRLYRNLGAMTPPKAPAAPKFGKWHYLGPFDNPGGRAFDTSHPVEKQVDLAKRYPGKGGQEAVWREGKFTDGAINDLRLFGGRNNENAAVYLYREIDVPAPVEIPASLGSDDTLSVWLNGKKILANNVSRGAAPDQDHVVLKLKAGKNHLLLKVCQGTGDWAFYFKAGAFEAAAPKEKCFEDVSARVGLGPEGIGSRVKGDTLTVGDVNGDGRPDFLYGAGTGMLVLNTPQGFVLARDSGIAYQSGKVGPVFVDYDNDGHLDLFVPQRGTCKLFKGDGKGHFTDVTARAGDLAAPVGWATCAAWGDFDNDGYLDLVVGCLRGPNRFFRNRGDGTFEDCTTKLGLDQRIFNTQAVCLVDLNNDGVLDMVFNNEGQESCVLLGSPPADAKRIPVTLQVAGRGGVIGSRVAVLDKEGRTLGVREISGGDGRGGQPAAQARFALAPGTYRVQVRYSSGRTRSQVLTVAGSPVRGRIDDAASDNE
jgi:FG-GAP-like repeat/FG-GAP repeat